VKRPRLSLAILVCHPRRAVKGRRADKTPPIPLFLSELLNGRERSCAGRLQLIATIDDPVVNRRILAHLRLPGARDGPRPPATLAAMRADQHEPLL